MLFQTKEGIRHITYAELLEIVRIYTGTISSLNVKSGDRVVVQSENCVEWAWIDWACRCLGVIVVPIYPTLPEDQSQYILRDCGAKIAIVGNEEQSAKNQGVDGVEVIPIQEIVNRANAKANVPSVEDWNRQIDSIQPDEVTTIIYTSGTTGDPKGAMLTHANFTRICEATLTFWPLDENDCFLSFLPIAHVYERVAGQALPISMGASIAYAQSLRSLATDMVTFKPTIMLCVPRVLEALRDRILDGVSKQPPLHRKLFSWTLSQGKRRLEKRFAPFAKLLDGLVAKKIRERTGGKLRFFVSGGAALPHAVSEFYHSLGMMILQGYGLTETAAITAANLPSDNRPETIGKPIPSVEAMFADDGELLIRGPSRMVGYYNMPEATAQAIDKDGWFHTGDIGEWVDGYIKITDRKKDLIVLGNGKNVAPQMIENRLRESALIDDAVVIGDGMEYVSALVVPDFNALRKVAAERGAKNLSNDDLTGLESVRALIKSEISKINKGLADYERVKKHAVLDHPFTIESGELTPTLKVKRRVIKEKYKDIIAWLSGE
jgi:long-chain acyl-CoA synthetase